MSTTALAQEKVWFDKPSYDKAERLYFERMAKVVSHKIMETCALNIVGSLIDNRQNAIITNTSAESKPEKIKDNKSLALDNGINEIVKHTKCQIKNAKANKKEDANIQKIESFEEKEKHDSIDIKEKDVNITKDAGKKCNPKEVKEKKNKADTRHRNRDKGKSDIKEQKEQLPGQVQIIMQGTQQSTCPLLPAGGSLANEVAKARQHIKQSLQCMDGIAALAGATGVSNQDVVSRVAVLEKENQDLRNVVQELQNMMGKFDRRMKLIEEVNVCSRIAICPAKPPSPKPQTSAKDDDDGVDLFGSDSEGEDAEAAKIRQERIAVYAAKKSKKPALIAKSNIILDVKPFDDETDMQAMEAMIRKIETDGLRWGAAKLIPLVYGIHKLQISCVVEDDKVSVDWLTDKIQEYDDYVQSVDIAAFNKV